VPRPSASIAAMPSSRRRSGARTSRPFCRELGLGLTARSHAIEAAQSGKLICLDAQFSHIAGSPSPAMVEDGHLGVRPAGPSGRGPAGKQRQLLLGVEDAKENRKRTGASKTLANKAGQKTLRLRLHTQRSTKEGVGQSQ